MSDSHTLVFRFEGWAGKDSWRSLTPLKWQASAAARKLLRAGYMGVDLKATVLLIQMPGRSYRVLDDRGRVELHSGIAAQFPG